DFLASLAAQRGAVVRVADGKLDFAVPTQASRAPRERDESRQNPLVIEKGVNLLWLRSTVTAAGQVPEVEVRGWDVAQKQAVVAGGKGATARGHTAAAEPTTRADT